MLKSFNSFSACCVLYYLLFPSYTIFLIHCFLFTHEQLVEGIEPTTYRFDFLSNHPTTLDLDHFFSRSWSLDPARNLFVCGWQVTETTDPSCGITTLEISRPSTSSDEGLSKFQFTVRIFIGFFLGVATNGAVCSSSLSFLPSWRRESTNVSVRVLRQLVKSQLVEWINKVSSP